MVNNRLHETKTKEELLFRLVASIVSFLNCLDSNRYVILCHTIRNRNTLSTFWFTDIPGDKVVWSMVIVCVGATTVKHFSMVKLVFIAHRLSHSMHRQTESKIK